MSADRTGGRGRPDVTVDLSLNSQGETAEAGAGSLITNTAV